LLFHAPAVPGLAARGWLTQALAASGDVCGAYVACQVLTDIFMKTCGKREALTIFSLSLCLLLRTFGSVWVARHWYVRSRHPFEEASDRLCVSSAVVEEASE
jgi:hypothetical protein